MQFYYCHSRQNANFTSASHHVKVRHQTRCTYNSYVLYTFFCRLHALVVGPGLGRDSSVIRASGHIMSIAKDLGLSLVIVTTTIFFLFFCFGTQIYFINSSYLTFFLQVVDADGLIAVNKNPDTVKGYRWAILTPNVNEFSRLWSVIFPNTPLGKVCTTT